MLSSAYLSRKLTSPIPTKDGGTLRTIEETCEYMAAIGKERELRSHWQRVRELMLQEADVAAVSHRARLAVLKDAKVDVTALSEPIERWMGEPPPALVSNGKLKLEPPTEPMESNERFDSDSKEDRRPQEELQQAEARQAAEEERRQEELQQTQARQAAEEERRRQEELERAEARHAAEEERRRQEELQRAEARQAAEKERRRQEAENKPFWNRFLAMLRARDS
jgi:hypothetical protein